MEWLWPMGGHESPTHGARLQVCYVLYILHFGLNTEMVIYKILYFIVHCVETFFFGCNILYYIQVIAEVSSKFYYTLVVMSFTELLADCWNGSTFSPLSDLDFTTVCSTDIHKKM